MSETMGRDRERVRQILEQRARRLARPPAPPRPDDLMEVVTFHLGRERYALAALRVREVFRLQAYSSLPGAPPPIAGVSSHRGELLTLIDLRSTLGLSSAALNDLGRVLVLERGRTRVGLLVDRVEGAAELPRSSLHPAPSRGPTPADLLLGVSEDALILLDVDGILELFDGGDAP